MQPEIQEEWSGVCMGVVIMGAAWWEHAAEWMSYRRPCRRLEWRQKGAWRGRAEGTAGTSEVAGVVVVSETACTCDDIHDIDTALSRRLAGESRQSKEG